MAVTVSLQGDVDVRSVPGVRERLLRAVSAAPGATVQVDMSRVTFLDSSGLGVLVAARRHAVESGGRLALVEVPPPVAALLRLTGLAAHLGSPR